MEFKYNLPNLQRLEAIYKANDYIVRYEKGHFNSGFCVLKDKKVVVVNKFFDTEARINCLLEIIDVVQIDSSRIEDEKLLKFFQQLPIKPKNS